MIEPCLLAIVISSATFFEIPPASNFSLKLSRPEVLIFFSLLMNVFPSLSPLKNHLPVEPKLICVLTSEKDVDTKTDFARLELPARPRRGLFELSSTLLQLG